MNRYLSILREVRPSEPPHAEIPRREKSEISEITPQPIRATSCPLPVADVWGDEHEERAAIIEEGSGATRTWAEPLARLHPDRPPLGDVSLARWERFLDDCGRFLDGGWAAKAAALGWTPLDLFGCDRERPFARVDCAGLVWLIDGRKIIALSEETATIETGTGARLIYRRCSVATGHIVLAWEVEQ